MTPDWINDLAERAGTARGRLGLIATYARIALCAPGQAEHLLLRIAELAEQPLVDELRAAAGASALASQGVTIGMAVPHIASRRSEAVDV